MKKEYIIPSVLVFKTELQDSVLQVVSAKYTDMGAQNEEEKVPVGEDDNTSGKVGARIFSFDWEEDWE